MRYAIRSVRSWGFLSPAKTILVPTEKFLVKKERREEVSIEREDRNNRKRKRIKNGFLYNEIHLLPGMYFFGLRR